MSQATTPLPRLRDSLLDIALLVGAFLVAVLIAGPHGNFPLNDDWAWADTTRRLITEHAWRPTDWGSMPLISHVTWGGMFCVVAGDCSYDTLRWSVITAAAITVAIAYLTGREVGLSRFQAAIVPATLAANPLFVSQALTYMTDVTFVFFAAASVYFYVRTLKRRTRSDLAIAVVLSVIATLCRQLGPFAPAAFAVALVWRDGLSVRNVLRAAWPALVSVAALVAFNAWQSATGQTSLMYTLQSDTMVSALTRPMTLVRNVGDIAAVAFVYLGLFCLPITLARPAPETGRLPALARGGVIVAILLGLLIVLRRLHNTGRFPFAGNILNPFGIGPHPMWPLFELPDSLFSRLLMGPGWWIVTVVGILGGIMLLWRVLSVAAASALQVFDHSRRPDRTIEVFLLVASTVYLAPLLLSGSMYDRYILPLMMLVPFVGVSFPAKAAPSRLRQVSAVTLIALLAFVTVAWEHDYMSWNRARWTVLDRAVAKGIPAANINGGFEFTFPGCYTPKLVCTESQRRHDDANYLTTFAPVEGYRVVDREAYELWLPAARRDVYLMERTTAVGPATDQLKKQQTP